MTILRWDTQEPGFQWRNFPPTGSTASPCGLDWSCWKLLRKRQKWTIITATTRPEAPNELSFKAAVVAGFKKTDLNWRARTCTSRAHQTKPYLGYFLPSRFPLAQFAHWRLGVSCKLTGAAKPSLFRVIRLKAAKCVSCIWRSEFSQTLTSSIPTLFFCFFFLHMAIISRAVQRRHSVL